MFDGSDESDDNQSYDSDWSESFWKDDEEERRSFSLLESKESSHDNLNTPNNTGNLCGSDASYGISTPGELSNTSQNNDVSTNGSNINRGPSMIRIHLEPTGGMRGGVTFSENDFSDGEMGPYFDPACTIKFEDIMGNRSATQSSSSYSGNDRRESEESRQSNQAGGGSIVYFNSNSYRNPPGFYELDCNPSALLNFQPPSGYATIIRAFSIWEDMEQFEKPPPPASKEVVDNLGTMEVTEKSYQCPVCLGICEVGEILKILPCSHAFHSDCILPWLEKTNTCPLCRSEMPTDNEDYELFKSAEAGRQLRA